MACECITTFCVNGAIAIVIFILMRFVRELLTIRHANRTDSAQILKSDWKKDVVYLYQFPVPAKIAMPNPSPYCAKLEMFLRVHNLRYEKFESIKYKSREGKIPFIEFNGEQLHDSELIILTLTKHFDLKDNFGDEQKAHIHTAARMLDMGVFFCIGYEKFGTNNSAFVDAVTNAPAILKIIAKPFAYLLSWRTLNYQGVGRHSPAEVRALLRADLEALNTILGEKQFLFGDQPSVADCCFFGHISAAISLPYDMSVKEFLEEDFPRLKVLYERIAEKYFSDIYKQKTSK